MNEARLAILEKIGDSDTCDLPDGKFCGATWFDTDIGETVQCACLRLHREVVVSGVHELVPA